MKLVIVPGFLGYAAESHHLDLLKRTKMLGIDGTVVESQELANKDFMQYRLSKHIATLNDFLNQLVNDQVVLVGVSLGGVAAIAASLDRKNITKLVCIVSPFQFANGDDMEPKIAEWKSEGEYTFTSSRYGEIAVPYDFVTDAQQYDARAVVSELGSSKLFLAGSLDERVPSSLTRELAYKASNPKMYRLIEGMRHDYKNQPVFTKLVNDYVLDFIVS